MAASAPAPAAARPSSRRGLLVWLLPLAFLLAFSLLSRTVSAHPAGAAAPDVQDREADSADDDSRRSPRARTLSGPVVGVRRTLDGADPIEQFLGIPFAKAPLGKRRFKPPVPPKPWAEPLDATAYKPSCIQQFNLPAAAQVFSKGLFNSPPPPAGEDEDCLYLNIYTPRSKKTKKRDQKPVLVWIYGGSYRIGTGTLPLYDGAAFAAYQDIVVVTFNYRLNVFGFPNAPELPPRQINPGLLDQRFVLEWVQQNIAFFGGDRNKVTIVGESAGATSVDKLLTSYTTRDAPFRGAILQSGQTSYNAVPSATNNTASWRNLTSIVGCTGSGADVLECMRAKPAEDLRDALQANALAFAPAVDNVTYVAAPASARARGDFAQVPIMAGSNNDEGTVFYQSQTNFTKFLEGFLVAAPQLIEPTLAAYPAGGVESSFLVGDLLGVRCNLGLLTNATVARGVPAWRYLFNATVPNYSPLLGALGVFHSSEIQLVFGSYFGGPVNDVTLLPSGLLPTNLPATDRQRDLSSFMNKAWADFVKDPKKGPGWAPVSASGGNDLGVLGANGGTGVTVINTQVIDGGCPLFLPAFRAVTGPDIVVQ